jgi:CRP/FNR family transcriptional regulator, cyclic AMP receptor protein
MTGSSEQDRSASDRGQTAAPAEVLWAGPAHVVHLLELDRTLGRRLAPQSLRAAERDLTATVRYLRRGPWAPGAVLDDRRSPAGLLLLEGLIIRRVRAGPYRDIEIVGAGDVLSPWSEEEYSVPSVAAWSVMEDVCVAVIDRTFEGRCSRYPGVMGELVSRAVRRAERQAVQRTLSHIRGLEIRLWALLWHLADRWGKVQRDGVLLDLQLSHEVLADLVGARRPSVSTAMGHLEREGRVLRSGRRWLLCGLPPDEQALGSAATPHPQDPSAG